MSMEDSAMPSPDFQPCVYILCKRSQRHAVHRRDVRVAQACARTQNRSRQRIHPSLPRARTCVVRATRNDANRNPREKTIKGWKRKWKLELIQKQNPYWNDLYDALLG